MQVDADLAQSLHALVIRRNHAQTIAFDGVVRAYQLILSQKSQLQDRCAALSEDAARARAAASAASSSAGAASSGVGSVDDGNSHAAANAAQVRTLEAKVFALQEQLTAKWQEVSELTKAQLTMTQTVAQANRVQQEAQASAEEWRQTLKKCQSSLKAAKVLAAAKAGEVEALQAELQNVRQMLERSEKHLCSLTSENEGLVSRMIEEKMGMMQELNKMTTSCDKMKAQLGRLTEENARLKAEAKALAVGGGSRSGSDTEGGEGVGRKSSGIWAALTGGGKRRGSSAAGRNADMSDAVAESSGWKAASCVACPTDAAHVVRAHDSEINDVAFSGTSVCTASGDGTVKVWDARTASLRSKHCVGGSVLCVDAAKGLVIAGTTDAQAVVYSIETERQRFVLSGHKGKVVDVRFSASGKTAASVGTDRCVRIFDLAGAGKCIRTLACPSACTSVAFTQDGSTVVTGHQDSGVRLWDVRAGAMTREVKGIHRAAVTSVLVAPARAGTALRLLSMSRDNTLKIVDGRTFLECAALKAQGFRVGWNYAAAAFSPDGGLVAAPSGDGRVLVWESLAGRIVKSFDSHERSAMAVAWSRRNVLGSVDNAGYMALHV
jgi:hypothetical protein